MESPQILSPCSSGDTKSPEFEFWMVRNPSFPEPNLLSADELFADGILLPLHQLQIHRFENPRDPQPDPPILNTTDPSPETLKVTPPEFTPSKRWRDIFKRNPSRAIKNREDKDKKGRNSGGVSVAELNINLWPFSRSRSDGNGGSGARLAATTRKASSAPCSRSNSAGESKGRRWPSSPSRAGVHLGRTSPVWQVRRTGSGRSAVDPVVRGLGRKGSFLAGEG